MTLLFLKTQSLALWCVFLLSLFSPDLLPVLDFSARRKTTKSFPFLRENCKENEIPMEIPWSGALHNTSIFSSFSLLVS